MLETLVWKRLSKVTGISKVLRIQATLVDKGQLDIFIYVTSNEKIDNQKVQFSLAG